MSNNLVPFQDVERMAMAIAKSNLFGMKTPEQALTLMLIAQAEGKHPASAASDYDIIQGKPSKKAKAMLTSFLEAGGKVTWHNLDDTIADATFSHPQGGEVRISWDLARAATAGLGAKDMWKKYPRQMLRSRTVSEGVSTVYPGATSGLYTPEEVQDMDDKGPKPGGKPKDVTPELAAAPKQVCLPLGSQDYVIPFGTEDFKGKKLKDLDPDALEQAVLKLMDFEASKGRELTGEKKAFVSNVREYLKKIDAERMGTPSPADGIFE